ncbi:hypothetical protein CAEBREN_13812 [Caenorhabditis brenneri]|uniref:Uncharacterized protein n=1 Tax=Caenorhabditis brenneri TaxID=135651 RepID=G0MBW3_CAEBE|nr:hypothetical protein CAEBREN_13812 [Caenorhabditis brenneri]
MNFLYASNRMSEDLKPLTPRSLPTLINEKLNALGLDTKEADLNVIRELFSVQQEDRVLSQKEVWEWKESERKILVNLRNYKNDTENIVKRGKCSLWFCLFFTLPISFCIYEAVSLDNEFYFKLFFRWPIHFIAILIHFYHLSIVNTHQILEPVQVLGIVNDDWQYSMTSTELQSRQNSLVSEWTQLVKNRVKNPCLVVLVKKLIDDKPIGYNF